METRKINWGLVVKVVVVVLLVVGWGLAIQQRKVAKAAENRVEEQLRQLKQVTKVQETKVASIIQLLEAGQFGFRIDAYEGGKTIRPLDGSSLYYQVRFGSEDVTVEFSQTPSQISQK